MVYDFDIYNYESLDAFSRGHSEDRFTQSFPFGDPEDRSETFHDWSLPFGDRCENPEDRSENITYTDVQTRLRETLPRVQTRLRRFGPGNVGQPDTDYGFFSFKGDVGALPEQIGPPWWVAGL